MRSPSATFFLRKFKGTFYFVENYVIIDISQCSWKLWGIEGEYLHMTKNEHKTLLAKIESTSKEVANNPAKARELLVKAGICTKKGNLKKPYK